MKRRRPKLTKLLLARLERGLSQEEVSREAGIARTRLSQLEHDPAAAREDELQKIYAALGRLGDQSRPTLQAAKARELLRSAGDELSDVLRSGEVTTGELAQITSLPLEVLEQLIEFSRLCAMSRQTGLSVAALRRISGIGSWKQT